MAVSCEDQGMLRPFTLDPFRVEVPEGDLEDLRRRLSSTRWPERETVDDWSQGVPLDYLREVAEHWRTAHDWRRAEADLNAVDQFVTDIEGHSIHFLHARSPHPDALPIVITHGWPGSVLEFRRVIAPLVDPTAHAGQEADAFHVVCPSLPGFGFSSKPMAPGTGVPRIAELWTTLMERLGYERWVAQGGDWGSAVTTAIGRLATAAGGAHGCVGIHLNMPVATPTPEAMSDPSPADQAAMAAFMHYQEWESGYSKQQSTRPQTLGYALTDSPVGQLAWILEKFQAWTDCDGHPENAIDREVILDIVTHYWLTASASSSARLYWESFSSFGPGPRVEIPTGVAAFPREIIRAPRSWCEQAYEITHWTDMPRGGHFAALEQPDLFVADVRDCFRSLR